MLTCLFFHTVYFSLPNWMMLPSWNKPDKVTLFDCDVSFNYAVAFITKSKYKRLEQRQGRDKARSSCRLRNDISICQLIQDPSSSPRLSQP